MNKNVECPRQLAREIKPRRHGHYLYQNLACPQMTQNGFGFHFVAELSTFWNALGPRCRIQREKQTMVCWRYGTAIGRTSTLLECPWGISTWQRDVGMEWKSKKLNQKWELNAAVSACSMAESPRKKNTCTFVQLPTSNWLAEVDISHLGQLKYGALRLNKEKPRMHMEKWQ